MGINLLHNMKENKKSKTSFNNKQGSRCGRQSKAFKHTAFVRLILDSKFTNLISFYLHTSINKSQPRIILIYQILRLLYNKQLFHGNCPCLPILSQFGCFCK